MKTSGIMVAYGLNAAHESFAFGCGSLFAEKKAREGA